MTVTEMREILETISYKRWCLSIVETTLYPYLQLGWLGPDAETGNVAQQKSRKWQLSPHMTRSELVQTAFKAVLMAEEHEVREHFLYRGKPVFGPHIDVDELHEICRRVDVRDSLENK